VPLHLGGKGLSWKIGGGVAVSGLTPGGPLWNAWADSLFEHVILRADGLLETLERITDELHWVVGMVRGRSARVSMDSLASGGGVSAGGSGSGGGGAQDLGDDDEGFGGGGGDGNLMSDSSPRAAVSNNAFDQWEDVAASLPTMEGSPGGTQPLNNSGRAARDTNGNNNTGGGGGGNNNVINSWRTQPQSPPDAALLAEVGKTHSGNLSEELDELTASVASCAAAAAADLPLLEANAGRARRGAAGCIKLTHSP
jgi:hypothetical protein